MNFEKSKDPEGQKKNSLTIITWHQHEKCFNDEKTLHWFWFWISRWKKITWHEKENTVVLNILILDLTKENIALHCDWFCFSFSSVTRLHYMQIVQDFCLPFVLRGNWIWGVRYFGKTFGNSIKTNMNRKIKTLLKRYKYILYLLTCDHAFKQCLVFEFMNLMQFTFYIFFILCFHSIFMPHYSWLGKSR